MKVSFPRYAPKYWRLTNCQSLNNFKKAFHGRTETTVSFGLDSSFKIFYFILFFLSFLHFLFFSWKQAANVSKQSPPFRSFHLCKKRVRRVFSRLAWATDLICAIHVFHCLHNQYFSDSLCLLFCLAKSKTYALKCPARTVCSSRLMRYRFCPVQCTSSPCVVFIFQEFPCLAISSKHGEACRRKVPRILDWAGSFACLAVPGAVRGNRNTEVKQFSPDWGFKTRCCYFV